LRKDQHRSRHALKFELLEEPAKVFSALY